MPSQGRTPVISIPWYMIPVLIVMVPVCWVYDQYQLRKYRK